MRIDKKDIVVTYEEEDESLRVIWKGKEEGTGHFHLRKSDNRGESSLHQFKGSQYLEGFWKDLGAEGMWRIALRK